jgi:hypothetical protein
MQKIESITVYFTVQDPVSHLLPLMQTAESLTYYFTAQV